MPNTDRDLSQRLVEALDGLSHVSPKLAFRPVHAKGLCATGSFRATRAAAELTRAPHMQGEPVRVTVRFSNASGDPQGSDAAREPRGMAVKFHLAGGQTTDLVGMTTPFFPVGTVRDFFEIVRVQTPDPVTRNVDEEVLKNFLNTHPEAAAWIQLVTTTPLPVSFARIAYFPIHAFCFVSASGKRTFVRYSWQPEAGVAGLSGAETLGQDDLISELRSRLSKGPVVFTLHLQLAGRDDDVDDPTKAWPSYRPSVKAGALEITDVVSDQRQGCEALSFDPTHLVDGIEASDDPILAARRGAYAFSAMRRTSRPSGQG